MCGIAGFSLSPDSKIKPRQLSNALLTAIEDRGYMASGYGWQHKDSQGYHSSATPGSALTLKFMPRQAKTVILHTRLATHGSVNDNRNNHPVTSPDDNIALVHNGVIYNHEAVRKHVTGKLPDVDTSVIPAVIEQHGVEKLDVLDGDAAIAWLDKRQQGTLHLARYQHSPLVICQLEDGSFVFASTEALLWRALVQLDLPPTFMHSPDELTYYTIKNGVIQSQQLLPEPMYSGSKYDYNYYRHQTSGAKGSTGTPSTDNPYGYDWYDDDYDNSWDYSNVWDYPKALASSEDTSDKYKFEPNPNEHFWAEIQEELAKKSEYLWYPKDQREMWLNELYYLANTPGVQLLDYGTVTEDGLMKSDFESVF